MTSQPVNWRAEQKEISRAEMKFIFTLESSPTVLSSSSVTFPRTERGLNEKKKKERKEGKK